MNKIAIAIHGGAGTILRSEMSPEKEAAYKDALKEALRKGYDLLKAGKSALDAVEAAVISLEDCPLFNAGRGSVFTATGTHEMDASVMEGRNLAAGAVSLVSGVRNPISLARLVMERTEHVFLAGEGAMEFARAQAVPLADEEWFHDDFRYQQWLAIRDSDNFQLDHSAGKDRKFGTVGAVALDQNGDIAAATSTGGMTNKKFGRVGDSPMIGAGTYANNDTCAVSCTGSGEFFIRGVAAYDLSCLIEHKGLSLQSAAREVVHVRLPKINGDGGLIAIDRHGHLALPFNTEGMYRASIDVDGKESIDIYGEGGQ